MIFSGGLLASLVGTTYFLAGDIIATAVGLWGSTMFYVVFKSQIITNKKKDASIVKTGIPGFDSMLSTGSRSVVNRRGARRT